MRPEHRIGYVRTDVRDGREVRLYAVFALGYGPVTEAAPWGDTQVRLRQIIADLKAGQEWKEARGAR